MKYMKILRKSNEQEMILEFLKSEIDSKRFNKRLKKVIDELKLNIDIIYNGNILNEDENKNRLKTMNVFRGYPDKELFKNFPKNIEWNLVELNQNDIEKVYYIDYDYWNELSNQTSSPIEAVKNINNGIEIYEVSNKPFIDGKEYIKNNKFPPVILLTCNNEKLLIIEGHSRMTIYGFDPTKLEGTYAYVGVCSEEEMKKYDSRMI